jgi:hypothetical protein
VFKVFEIFEVFRGGREGGVCGAAIKKSELEVS